MVEENVEMNAEWRADQFKDPASFTELLNADEVAEIKAAIKHAFSISDDFLEITKDDFPLPTLAPRLKATENELINGRGFVLLRGLPRDQLNNDEMCMAYWGIGLHLGRPWPQNHKGHLLGDVTDQGKAENDPNARGYELGGFALPFHTDGSDLVGLMCLAQGTSGGASVICNSVALYNELVRQAPDLAAELFKPQPYDFRGEQADGGKPYYEMPVFTLWGGRLFVRYIRPYILASQRHESAPRITEKAEQAMQLLDQLSQDPQYQVEMHLEPGDMQFINNYHLLHGRKAYEDDRTHGQVRHLKRLWLETEVLADRPPYFVNNLAENWGAKKVISRLDA